MVLILEALFAEKRDWSDFAGRDPSATPLPSQAQARDASTALEIYISSQRDLSVMEMEIAFTK